MVEVGGAHQQFYCVFTGHEAVVLEEKVIHKCGFDQVRCQGDDGLLGLFEIGLELLLATFLHIFILASLQECLEIAALRKSEYVNVFRTKTKEF